MKPYPSYKDSALEWIGEIPSGWEVGKLNHIVSKVTNGYVGPTRDVMKESGIRYIQGIHIKNGEIKYTPYGPYYVSDEWSGDHKKSILKEGDVLIVQTGTIGEVGYVTKEFEDCNCHALIIIRLKNKYGTGKYLTYFIMSNYVKNFFRTIKTGDILEHLNTTRIKYMKICLPPLPEQKQIVSFLDQKTQQIDRLVEKTEQKIQLLKEKRTSLINHCITKGLNPNVEMKDSGVEWIGEIPIEWNVRRVATFGTFSKGRGIKKDEVKTSGIPCIRYGEIYTEYDRIVFNTVSFIDEESSLNSELISKGDVLFTGSGETIDEIGKTIVYYGDKDIFVGGDVIILKLKDNLNPLFLSYMMNSQYVNHQKSRMGRGGIIVHIYSKQLKEIKAILPPIPEQQKIVEYLDEQTKKIDTTIENETKRIELLKEYRQSLISEVVTGKIDVRDWNG